MSDFEKGRTWAEMEADLAAGDQDYLSVVGWDPNKEAVDKLIAEEKKNFPRGYAPKPAMLYIQPVQEYVAGDSQDVAVKQLFGPFWHDEEVAVLFATPGVGKSALAVQIAECLARGVPLMPFDKPEPGCEVPPKSVLYIDFELTRSQFARRYTAAGRATSYQFSPEFLRAELFWDGRLIDGYEDFTDMIFENIERKIDQYESNVLICDNITFLSRSSTANASIAFRLMNRLQAIKKQRMISVLAVAHTTKHGDHLPLTENDLQGSIDLAKVADSMFALGRSGLGRDIRYLKQVKSRSGRIEHGEDNVASYRFGQFDLAAEIRPRGGDVKADNFLGFQFIGFDNEQNHLAAKPSPRPKKLEPKLDERRVVYAKQLSRAGHSSADIAKRLGVGRATAYRYSSGKNYRGKGVKNECLT